MEKQLGKIIQLQKITDRRGNLTVAEQLKDVPFEISRVYWTYDIPGGARRGGHAHIHCREMIIAASGSFTVTLDDGKAKQSFMLNHPNKALFVDTGIWRTLEDFSSGAVCLVLAEDPYDEKDYIYDYQEFLKYKHV
ncbi:MAG: FdtA/QdtA family cupin domain-containing protein [Prevotellaceae bacterium]|nr:FdtA/QdtA family cupin domain-containing protein [Prevotellaceae bacterium]